MGSLDSAMKLNLEPYHSPLRRDGVATAKEAKLQSLNLLRTEGQASEYGDGLGGGGRQAKSADLEQADGPH
ncbi:hypothetical protein E2562_013053 [Oryza meyeriana var. granulata]|uniref:Uncharacterized protein n=1 Tax=Oryza meyeriana var. granulata TaxID=110450 RepID=A0A6G1DH89_9ORYZ|nr:hypothetical protein E2562_013053 [Oryza meyeriana var. granulata]